MIKTMLSGGEASRVTTATFRGMNHTPICGEDETFWETGISADYYPALSPAGKLVQVQTTGDVQGIITKDALCMVRNGEFYLNGAKAAGFSLSSTGEKTMVSMGAYVVIFPDRKWINTKDLTDWGTIDNTRTTDGVSSVSYTMVTSDGEAYPSGIETGATPPADPGTGDYWIDTTDAEQASLKVYAANGMWTSVVSTYVRIEATGIGQGFAAGDGVTISGVTAGDNLTGSFVLKAAEDDAITITGLLGTPVTNTDEITVTRAMPLFDYVTEAGNRLWACRYGPAANGQIVNEIYGSKLGDFKNWSCFEGLSTDSWAASCGTDGIWTGAATHLGYPLFFKENVLHKVYISSSGAHQIQETALNGVESGSSRSLATVGQILYWKSREGVMAYDGSLPTAVGGALGKTAYRNAAAGAGHGKLWISMQDPANAWHLFAYDPGKGFWHRAAEIEAAAFCEVDGAAYILDGAGNILRTSETVDTDTAWSFETGVIGATSPDAKTVKKISANAVLPQWSTMKIEISYDETGEWMPAAVLEGAGLRAFQIPIHPARAKFFRLRFSGRGDFRIYSLTKTVRIGSER